MKKSYVIAYSTYTMVSVSTVVSGWQLRQRQNVVMVEVVGTTYYTSILVGSSLALLCGAHALLTLQIVTFFV